MSEEAILGEIHEAFRGVTREGGVSWTESRAIDDYEEHRRAEYRAQDKDSSWTELPDDPNWRVDMGVGGFSFLDPIGFRYYLPAAMVVALRGGPDEEVCFALRLRPEGYLRDHYLMQWSLLSAEQRRCVRHFVEHMMRAGDEYMRDYWKMAFERYWKDVE